jgi:hypothetical protein
LSWRWCGGLSNRWLWDRNGIANVVAYIAEQCLRWAIRISNVIRKKNAHHDDKGKSNQQSDFGLSCHNALLAHKSVRAWELAAKAVSPQFIFFLSLSF